MSSSDLLTSIQLFPSACRLQRLNAVVFAVAAVISMSLAADLAPAHADTYGAIAFSDQNGYYAWSVDQGSAKGAEARALSSCMQRGGGCKIAISFSNSCAALAVGDNNRFATGQANNRSKAQSLAINACRIATGGGACSIRAAYCVNPPSLDAKPGLWQLTEAKGGRTEAINTRTSCVKSGDLAPHNWVSLLDAAAADATCSSIDLNTSSNSIHWKFACTGNVQKTTEGSIRFDSAQHFSGTLSRKEPSSPSSPDVMRLDGKWLGQCTSAD